MQWLELHNVEYGECIVLGGRDKNILMVDCGSSNQKIRETNVPFRAYVDPTLLSRYSGCKSRDFILSHYHRDHLCGLVQILESRPNYFERIFLPVSPCNRQGRPILLEFAAFVTVFLRHYTEYAQINLSVLRLFDRVSKAAGASCVYPLEAGSSFVFDGVEYEILWPDCTSYAFSELLESAVEEMIVCLSSPFLPRDAQVFLELKQRLCDAYLACCKHAPLREEDLDRMNAILLEMEDKAPAFNLLPPAPDIVEILTRPVTLNAYSDELNASGFIFHNKRVTQASLDDLLMTGDATPDSMDAVAEKLYTDYYILKAPHHGTAGHWSHLFSEISASHVLISNGDYHKAGQVAQEYAELPSIKHCTNCSACPWYEASGCSCNRMACCYDLPAGPGLTIKCPAVRGAQKDRKSVV